MVSIDGTAVGETSSGNFSPMLGVGIALGFLDTSTEIALGDAVEVEVRGRSVPATIVKPPFWP